MSGVLKKIGKVFKKIVKSKIFKAVLIAAAVYFTAGVALAAGGSAFAASLPGITAAGQAVGLSGVGAIAATGAEVGAAAMGSVGMMEAAGAGAAGDIGMGAVAGAADAGSIAASNAALAAGELAPIGAGEMLATDMIPEAVGAVGESASSATSSLAGSAPTTSSGFGGAGTDAAVNTANAAKGAGGQSAWDSFTAWTNKNPVVAKAAMTFGSEGLKTGFQAFAAKSQQDAAEERYQQDRTDRQRREAPSFMTLDPKGAYNKGVVNSVAGVQP